MSFSKSDNSIAKLFAQGKAGQSKTDTSTGDMLTYHGNLIARWKADGLYISNGGYVPDNGATGSLSTKFLLNAIDGVSIEQRRKKWYLNGEEWDGEWIKVEGVRVPEIDKSKAGEVFDTSTKYVRTGGWRGYSEPKFACAGANDTGMYSDSPCPSNVRENELGEVKKLLIKEGIKTKQIVCESSNVFCVHVYLVPMLKHVDRAREIVREYIQNNETRLLYAVD